VLGAAGVDGRALFLVAFGTGEPAIFFFASGVGRDRASRLGVFAGVHGVLASGRFLALLAEPTSVR
jgi:hypothetical protein